MNRLIRYLENLVEWLGWAARACVLLLVLLVASNVALRYFFSFSPVALQELEWHLISPIALLGLAYAMKHKADVRVDFLYERMTPLQRHWLDLAAALMCIAVGGILCWMALPYVMQSYAIGETSADPGGLAYRFLLKAFIPLGFGLLALQGLAELLKTLQQLWQEYIHSRQETHP